MNSLRTAVHTIFVVLGLGAFAPSFGAPALLHEAQTLKDWSLQNVNPFGADDSGGAGSGSFSRTIRSNDPQGGWTAEFLQENGAAGYHYAARPVDLEPGVYTMSAWMKPGGRTCAELNISGEVSAAGVRFNLGTGTVYDSYEHGRWNVLAKSITAGAHGWQYCSATFRLSGKERSSILILSALEKTNSYPGNSQAGIFVWNVSLSGEMSLSGGAPGFRPPLLRADPLSRYLVDPSGKAVALAGSHTWNTVQDWSGKPLMDFGRYLQKLRRDGHNCTRLWQLDLLNWDWIPWGSFGGISPLPWNRTGPGTAADGGPKLDLNSLNEDYFIRLSNRVASASAHGVYAQVMLFEGCWVLFTGGGYFQYSPYNSANNVNGTARAWTDVYTLNDPQLVALQENYVKKVVDTLNGFDNVLYEIINEAPPASAAWQSHMVSVIKEYQAGKPKQHPVGMSGFYAQSGEEEETNRLLRESPSDWIALFGGHSARAIYGTNPPPVGPTGFGATDAFEAWNVVGVSPFGTNDSGARDAGSFSGTQRTADPSGGFAADFIQEDTSHGYHWVARAADLPAGSYVMSAWLKSAGRMCADLNISGETSAAGVRVNLASGEIADVYQHGLWSVRTQSTTAGGDGWFHCTATVSLTGTEPVSLLVLPALESGNHYTGDGTSGIFVSNLSVVPVETKVAFLDTDHIWGIGGDSSWVWKAFTRGYNLLYMDPDETTPRDLGWGWTLDPAASRAMGDALSYARRMNLGAMAASTTTASTGYALVNPGVEYLAWQPHAAQSFAVDLAPGKYVYEWFDPATRSVQSGTLTAPGGPAQFAPPVSNASGAVLYLKAVP